MSERAHSVVAKEAQTAAHIAKADPRVTQITDPELIHLVLAEAGPHVNEAEAEGDLTKLYRVAYHHPTDSLIIASRGAVLYCHSPKTETPYLLFHRGVWVYRPGLGTEMCNTGVVGNPYSGEAIVRAESACSPSFLFGSQRCNCHHQWQCVSELAARAARATPPTGLSSGHSFERWVQSQTEVADDRVRFTQPAQRGFLMIHLDCQNGMGSGYTAGEDVEDLYARASMRHRGEYAAEQVFGASMAGAFRSIGIEPDPRKEDGGIGYQTPFIVMDFLGVSHELAFLSNNPLKWAHPLADPYQIRPVPMIGEVNLAGQEEAESRHTQFGHSDISGLVDFDSELARLSEELGIN